MADNELFNQHLERAVKHYSSLFTLPSYKNIILFSTLFCVVGGLLSGVSLSFSYHGLFNGIILGFSLSLATLLSNYLLTAFILKGDAIYDLRRTSALSLFSWILWLLFIFMGSVAATFLGPIWAVRLCLIGFSAVLILRFIVFYATSSVEFKRFYAASILPSLLCLLLFTVLWMDTVELKVVFFFSVYSLAVSFLSSVSFVFFLNNVGQKIIGIRSMTILKAFLLNWIADLNAPFESILDSLSEEKDVEISVAKFEGIKPKALLVVPSVHPGPFKNVGSSLLPSMLKKALEQKFSCVACTPLGLLGHELDLSSQIQNQKIIEYTLRSMEFEVSETDATPFIKVRNDLATACCQIFGKSVIITFSLAPNTTEDFPQELGFFIRKEAERRGFQSCIIINAHNSINGAINPKEALAALKKVAIEVLEKAFSLTKKPFRVGAASITPKEFTLRDGMGPGGITALVVEVGSQKAAYVIIDGNNMVSGLREEILSSLNHLGIDEGEVFTTDTHSVNALTLNARGYHPLGEVIAHEKLIDYIRETINTAIANLEPVKVSCKSLTVPKVRVIGQESLEKLCLLPDMAVQRAKRIIVPLFTATAMALFAFLLLV